MRLMMRDVESMKTQSEIDGIQIFERRREVREMKREKDERQNAQRGEGPRAAQPSEIIHAGRSKSPSFRLPVRYPCRSRLM